MGYVDGSFITTHRYRSFRTANIHILDPQRDKKVYLFTWLQVQSCGLELFILLRSRVRIQKALFRIRRMPNTEMIRDWRCGPPGVRWWLPRCSASGRWGHELAADTPPPGSSPGPAAAPLRSPTQIGTIEDGIGYPLPLVPYSHQTYRVFFPSPNMVPCMGMVTRVPMVPGTSTTCEAVKLKIRPWVRYSKLLN
jgi:hypothetical protein